MFDFRNYAVQDAYLKRLAFFVEKKGFAGRLAKDEEIASLHGWNAHDYKTDDIAKFFSAAEKTGFSLSAQELSLRDFLVEKGLLEKRGKEYRGLNGAIISISQESAPYLRHTFLTHESSHAVFFADGKYRDFCVSLWNGMSREEKWFWILYFGWMNYDTNSALPHGQRSASLPHPAAAFEGAGIFHEDAAREVARAPSGAESAVGMNTWEKFGLEFEKKAGLLDEWLRSAYGFGAGTTFFLR